MKNAKFTALAALLTAAGLSGISAAEEARFNLVGPKTKAELLKTAADPQSGDRARALHALGSAKVNDAEFLKLLPKIYRESPETRMTVLWALREAGESARAAAQPLVKEALSDPSAALRGTALSLMAALKIPPEKNFAALLNDAELEVRLGALDALRAVGTAGEFLPAIQELVAKSPSAVVRRRAVQSLQGQNGKEAGEILRRGLKDKDLTVALAACDNLADADKPGEFAPLAEDLLPHLDATWAPLQARAVEAAGNICPEKIRDRLAGFCQSPDPRLARAALLTFGRITADAARADALPPYFSHADADVRRAAALALWTLRERKILADAAVEKTALAAARAEKTEAKIEGLWLLSRLRSQAAFPQALEWGKSAEPRGARAVLWLAGESQYAAAENWARDVALDKKRDDLTRSHAVVTLKKIGAKASAPALIKAVSAKTPMPGGMVVWTVVGRLREDIIDAILTLDAPGTENAADELLYSMKPAEESANIRRICHYLAEKKYNKDIEDIPEVVLKSDKFPDELKACVAEMYEKVTGKDSGYRAPVRTLRVNTFVEIEER